MTNRDKDALCRDLGDFARLGAFHTHAIDAFDRLFVAKYLVQFVIPQHLDLFVFKEAILQDFFGTETITAVNHGDLGGKICQEQCFFHGGVAAADHDNLHAAIEKAITGRTGRYTKAFEGFFAIEPEPFCPCARRQNHRVCGVGIPRVAFRNERPLRRVEFSDDIPDDFSAHRGGMLLHLHHELRPLNFGKARVVFHLGCGRQLAARLNPLHEDRR